MGKIQRIRESKTGKTIVKKGKSGIGRILFGRTGIILLLLLLQLGILFIVFSRLQQHIIYAYWLFVPALRADSDTDYQPTGKSGV